MWRTYPHFHNYYVYNSRGKKIPSHSGEDIFSFIVITTCIHRLYYTLSINTDGACHVIPRHV